MTRFTVTVEYRDGTDIRELTVTIDAHTTAEARSEARRLHPDLTITCISTRRAT